MQGIQGGMFPAKMACPGHIWMENIITFSDVWVLNSGNLVRETSGSDVHTNVYDTTHQLHLDYKALLYKVPQLDAP